jgi:hypothetical protein
LAANIHTQADAREYVDFVADMFEDNTMPLLRDDSLLSRISQAEFSAVSDPYRLIPELRLVGVWNAYVETIQAPEERKVTSAEVYNLRDAFWTMARLR